MKFSNHLFILIFLLFSLSYSFAQSSYTDKKGNVHLLGEVEISQLEAEAYSEWFVKGMAEYQSNVDPSKMKDLQDVQVKIFLGTWCGDTKNYLPKFVKTWKEAGLKESQLELIALHRDGDEYKRSPKRTEANYNIHRVPAFVFERYGQEIGRIVERPLNDLTTDMTQIGLGVSSKSRYRAVAILDDYVNNTPHDSLYENFSSTLNKMYREISGPGELNTYGYVQMAAKNYVKAEIAFRANTRIFKHDPNLQDSLGELYMEIEKYPEAKECFINVLKMKTADPRAIEMLGQINEQLEN